MMRLFRFLQRIYVNRIMIRAMAVRDLQQRYVGTLGGAFWAVLQPLAVVLTFWFVFSVGFKVRATGDAPFILFFVCGLAPWFMFSEAVNASVSVVSGNAHLVKKVVFPTEVLPVVQLVTAVVTHLAMLAVIMLLFALHRYPLSWHILQVPYYLFAGLALSLGFAWLLAALNVFFRDVGQIVTVVFGLWFWLTPIVWPLELVPEKFRPWLELNPMYYVVEGYRGSLLYATAVWERPWLSLYFWVVCLAMLALGATVFRRLKPEFAEVL